MIRFTRALGDLLTLWWRPKEAKLADLRIGEVCNSG